MKKILIIEDEATIAQLIRLYLEQANFQVLTAGDGVAGLELHARERPDLVILDLDVTSNGRYGSMPQDTRLGKYSYSYANSSPG